MNDTALITGSTSGIGKAFADRLAKEGYHLILVARNEEKLKLQSECLFQTYHIPVHIVTCNLENPHAAEHVFQKVKEANLSVQLLVNNAGFNEYGCFLDTNSEKEFGMMQLHMVFTTQMMKLFLPEMIDNGYGRILNIGSTGAYIPCPYDAVYAATKSYLLSVSKGINAELKHTGVSLTVLCPGSTRTQFAVKAGMEQTLLFRLFVMGPEKVADIGYRAMMKRKASVIAGFYNKLLVLSSFVLPKRVVNFLSKKMLLG